MAFCPTTIRAAAPRVAASAKPATHSFFNSSISRSIHCQPINASFFSSGPAPKRLHTPFFSRNFRSRFNSRFFHNSRAYRQADPGPAKAQSLGQRMTTLSREYGWSALGVYLMLSALDFPFCYLLVRTLGTDRIGEWEHAVTSHVGPLIPQPVKDAWYGAKGWFRKQELKWTGDDDMSDAVEMAGWDLTEADRAKEEETKSGKEASLATQLALAYAIHKSFIFIRVPLTAAVTPKVVKILRGWGWDIGKRTTKAAKVAKKEAIAVAKTTGVPRAGGVGESVKRG